MEEEEFDFAAADAAAGLNQPDPFDDYNVQEEAQAVGGATNENSLEDMDAAIADPIPEAEDFSLYGEVQKTKLKKQERRDAEGETYQMPEKYQAFEDTDIGDFITDIWRSAKAGLDQRALIGVTDELALGGNVSQDQLEKYVAAANNAENSEQSREMLDFSKETEECGGGAWCTMKAIASNPSILPQIMTSSLVSMTSIEGAVAAASAGGAGALASGPLGVALGPAAAVGVLSGYTDGMLSFTDFLKEELNGRALTDKNVEMILNDPARMSRIRTRALGRGTAIGLFDALTLGVATGVNKSGRAIKKLTNVARKTGGKAPEEAIFRGVQGIASQASGNKGVGAVAGLVVEGAGGSAGEFAGQVVAGQEIDAGEILLEGLAEFGGPGTISIAAKLAKGMAKRNQALNDPAYGTYKNSKGEKLTRDEIYEMTDEDLLDNDITVYNDPPTEQLIAERKATVEADRGIETDITGKQRTEYLGLQLMLDSLANTTGESAAARKGAIKAQMKRIREKTLGLEKPKPEGPANAKAKPAPVENVIIDQRIQDIVQGYETRRADAKKGLQAPLQPVETQVLDDVVNQGIKDLDAQAAEEKTKTKEKTAETYRKSVEEQQGTPFQSQEDNKITFDENNKPSEKVGLFDDDGFLLEDDGTRTADKAVQTKEERTNSLASQIAELGDLGKVGTPEYNDKLAEFKRLNDEQHWAKVRKNKAKYKKYQNDRSTSDSKGESVPSRDGGPKQSTDSKKSERLPSQGNVQTSPKSVKSYAYHTGGRARGLGIISEAEAIEESNRSKALLKAVYKGKLSFASNEKELLAALSEWTPEQQFQILVDILNSKLEDEQITEQTKKLVLQHPNIKGMITLLVKDDAGFNISQPGATPIVYSNEKRVSNPEIWFHEVAHSSWVNTSEKFKAKFKELYEKNIKSENPHEYVADEEVRIKDDYEHRAGYDLWDERFAGLIGAWNIPIDGVVLDSVYDAQTIQDFVATAYMGIAEGQGLVQSKESRFSSYHDNSRTGIEPGSKTHAGARDTTEAPTYQINTHGGDWNNLVGDFRQLMDKTDFDNDWVFWSPGDINNQTKGKNMNQARVSELRRMPARVWKIGKSRGLDLRQDSKNPGLYHIHKPGGPGSVAGQQFINTSSYKNYESTPIPEETTADVKRDKDATEAATKRFTGFVDLFSKWKDGYASTRNKGAAKIFYDKDSKSNLNDSESVMVRVAAGLAALEKSETNDREKFPIQRALSEIMKTLTPGFKKGLTGEELRKAVKVSAQGAWLALTPLLDNGMIDISTGWTKGKPYYDINVKDNKAFEEFIEGAGQVRKEGVTPPWHEAIFTKIAPIEADNDGYYSNGLEIISNAYRGSNKPAKAIRDSLNKLNSTPHTVNAKLLKVLKLFKRKGVFNVNPDGLTKGEFRAEESSKRATFGSMAKAEAIGDREFYMFHKVDNRGREYPAISGFNPQGNKVAKSLFYLPRVVIGKMGWRMMNIQATDAFGARLDTFEERYNYAQENMDTWMKWATDPQAFMNEIMKADEPELFLATIMEMSEAIANPEGVEQFESGLPIHHDATNSGAQILSALSWDEQTGKEVNLTSDHTRGDLYQKVADYVWNKVFQPLTPARQAIFDQYQKDVAVFNDLLTEAYAAVDQVKIDEAYAKIQAFNKENKANSKIAEQVFFQQPQVVAEMRAIAKHPVMTKYYNAKPFGMEKAIFRKFRKKFPGMQKSYAAFLARELSKGVEVVAPGPQKVMGALTEASSNNAQQNKPTKYKTPLGMEVVLAPKEGQEITLDVKYKGNDPSVLKNKKEVVTPADGSHRIINLNFVAIDTEQIDVARVTRGTVPNVVQSLDANLVHDVVNKTDFPVMIVHDSFSAAPGNMAVMDQTIRESFFEMFSQGTLLQDILEQMSPGNGAQIFNDWFPDGLGNLNINDILSQPNAFAAGNGGSNRNSITSTPAERFKSVAAAEITVRKWSETRKKKEINEEAKPCKVKFN